MTITTTTTHELKAKRFFTVSDVSREVKRLKAEGHTTVKTYKLFFEGYREFFVIKINDSEFIF